jgi:hypothetical protein
MLETMITNGPSKFDLMQALFVRQPTRPVFELSLTVGPVGLTKVKCMVNSVESEDGSGESWNIEGYVGDKKFTAFYRTDKRTGMYRTVD